MTTRTALLRTVATVTLLGAVASGCSRTTTTETAAGPTSKAPVDSVNIQVSDALTGQTSEPTTPLECRWYANQGYGNFYYSFNAAVRLNGQQYSILVSHSTVLESQRTFPITSSPTKPEEFATTSFYLLASKPSDQWWQNRGVAVPSQVKGTLTINPDRSGSLDATLSHEKGKSGPPLTIKASWSCSTVLGKR